MCRCSIEGMILVDWQILDRIFGVFQHRSVRPRPCPAQLSRYQAWEPFLWSRESGDVIDPYDKETITSHFREKTADSVVLEPGRLCSPKRLK